MVVSFKFSVFKFSSCGGTERDRTDRERFGFFAARPSPLGIFAAERDLCVVFTSLAFFVGLLRFRVDKTLAVAAGADDVDAIGLGDGGII